MDIQGKQQQQQQQPVDEKEPQTAVVYDQRVIDHPRFYGTIDDQWTRPGTTTLLGNP